MEKELAELWANEPGEWLSIDKSGRAFADPAKNAPHQSWMRRIKRLHDRLEEMTGKRPAPKPMPRLED